MKKTTSFFLTLLLLSIVSCVKDTPRFTIPYARVYFEIDLNGLDSDLHPFGYKVFTQARTVGEHVGYAGLLIFRTTEGAVFAYDLCCPHEKSKDIKVRPTNAGKAVCPKCGSVFVTMFGLGTPESGLSQEPLQRYIVNRKSQREGAFVITN